MDTDNNLSSINNQINTGKQSTVVCLQSNSHKVIHYDICFNEYDNKNIQ